MQANFVCSKCSLPIDAGIDLFTVCAGECGRFYHSKCVSLSESDLRALKGNIVWLCSGCLDKFRKTRDGRNMSNSTPKDEAMKPAASPNVEYVPLDVTTNSKPTEKSIEDEVRELKHVVAEIVKTMSKFNTTHSTVEPPIMHSTPISSPELLNGSNACVIPSNDEGLQRQNSNDHRNFSLLLTNIDESVAECDVHRMVVQSLGIEEAKSEWIEMVKLVPRWRSSNSIDFVSYKVVLDNIWRVKAMSPSTWPKHVKFREFIKKRTVTWKPV